MSKKCLWVRRVALVQAEMRPSHGASWPRRPTWANRLFTTGRSGRRVKCGATTAAAICQRLIQLLLSMRTPIRALTMGTQTTRRSLMKRPKRTIWAVVTDCSREPPSAIIQALVTWRAAVVYKPGPPHRISSRLELVPPRDTEWWRIQIARIWRLTKVSVDK